ncbi:peptidase M13 [Brachybacterium sp. JHP9]|uniref:Peptidase M13 n=1 Tax=Brachybacterium equifaecis TaxID=2910770 RepID=A0ABT0QWB1_9MICO|nr:M13-type metalloendopeptidase [Brachybacterium equifaecis]MCL6421949.1 peptidase M13 [Brachybacterium equifaecis]
MTSPQHTPARSGLDLSQVDPAIHLQDDLFGHVNGRWLAEHVMPADRSSDGEFRRLRDESEAHVREIIEEAAAAGADPTSDTGRIGTLYRLFMDEETIEAKGAAPLEPLLAEITAAQSLDQIAALMAAPVAGTSAVHAYVWTDDDDSSRYQVKLYQGGLGLPDESYYREDSYAEIREAYARHLARLAALASLPGREGLVGGDAAAQAAAVVDFETRLASCHVDVVRLRDSEASHNPMTAGALAELAPDFPWGPFFEGTGAPEGSFDTLSVSQPEFITAAAPLLAETPLDVLRTWLALHTVSSYAPYLSAAFVEEDFDFSGRTLSGAEELRERWKRGVALVEGAVGFAVGKEYVQRHFPPSHKETMEELVAALLRAYRTSISTLEWMTPATRKKALEKLEQFTPKIGYPERWREYDSLTLDPSDLVASVRAAREHETAHEFAKLQGPVDPYEWHMTPQTVNAYYNPGANEIVFPAAILQPPFFDADAEAAVNFGGIGAVIGHEIGHGFDDQGSKYDGAGNLRSWWTDEDRAAFEERTARLITQYEALSPRELDAEHHVNGALTIGENIGDLGGLSIALQAYLDSVEGSGPEIDGFTGVQRVFLSWATVWRGRNRPQESIRRLAIDPHSPAEFRCNTIAGHLDAFYEAFDVAEGDAMHIAPEQRVSIW